MIWPPDIFNQEPGVPSDLQQPEDFIFHRLDAMPEFSGRIFPVEGPQDFTPPLAVYHRTDTEPVIHLNGVSNICKFTVMIGLWSEDVSQLLSLAQKAKRELHGFRDDKVKGCFFVNQETQDNTDDDISSVIQSYTVWANQI